MIDFAALVGFLALAYAGAVKFLQGKLIDRKEVDAVQAESKRLNEEFKKAQKANDKKRMDKIMQEQIDHFPKLNGVMMKQFKPMIVILVVFMGFMWVINHIDPFVQDDMLVNLTDDGSGCDAVAGDGVYSACITPQENEGKWTAHVRAYEGSLEVASNETYFLYGVESWKDTYVENGKGQPMEVFTDKAVYPAGDAVTLTAVPPKMKSGMSLIIPITAPSEAKIDKVEATISNGTYFRADLPIAIPVLDIQSFYQPYWWFIFISLIANLSISFVMGKMKKSEKK
ncbi:MAG: EMC3/TMCO1 family protein [Candidatus Micrarchaeota archaeon]